MTRQDDDLGRSWPDQEEWNRWRDALADTAGRLQADRGVAEPWRLTVGWGALWAEYGDLRLRVAGEGVEVAGRDVLFDDVDRWVAFDRKAGPGRVLDRDRQAVAEWRQRIPAVRQFWEDVARRVFRDVELTTDRLPWEVVVHEDEPDWSATPAGVGGVVMDVPTPGMGRRSSSFPQIWVETPHTGRELPAMDDEADAVGYLAELVQEDVIGELHAAWPPCPRHPHPLEVHDAGGRPTWRCPTTPDIEVPIGELAELGDPSA